MIAVLMSCVAIACSKGQADQTPVAKCTLPPVISAPEGLPSDLPFPADARLTSARVKKKYVAIEGFSEQSVEQLFEGVRPDLMAKGFDIINTDYEGFEAELFIAKGSSLAGIVSFREGPCDGYVKVSVLYDPLETAEGRKAVRKTRKLSGEG